MKTKLTRTVGICPYRYQECLHRDDCTTPSEWKDLDSYSWSRKVMEFATACPNKGKMLIYKEYRRRQAVIEADYIV